MLPGSLRERCNSPCDINHKNKRCDEWFRAETKHFRPTFSGRISSIPVKEFSMQTEFARVQMITQQIRAWDVLDDRVLDAMRRTPREFFVPERYAEDNRLEDDQTDQKNQSGQCLLVEEAGFDRFF